MAKILVVSLSAVSQLCINYDYFKEQSEILLNDTLDGWSAHPKEIIDKQIPDLKEFDFYFKRLHDFRLKMKESLPRHCIFEKINTEEGDYKYMMIFDIDNILKDLYASKLQYHQDKLEDVSLIISELNTKIKSNNYIKNLGFLYSSDVDHLTEEMKLWTNIMRTLRKETFYLLDE